MVGMSHRLDALLRRATDGTGRGTVPGIVAMVTDRDGNVYEGAFGQRSLACDAAMTADTVFALFSASKAVTGTAVLQCVEEGLIDLDAPARDYVPELGELQVLEGFAPAGGLRLRAPRGDVTTRHLMLHTSGFGYGFCNATYERLSKEHGYPPISTGTMAALRTPLLFDPGTRWEYGSGIDWAGQVVEAVRARRLGDVLAERVFAPLGIGDMSFCPDIGMQARRAGMHMRANDGTLSRKAESYAPSEMEVQMGGHGLYGTVTEYMKFIRMWLNAGRGPAGRVLRPETVEMAVRSGLRSDQTVIRLPGIIPSVSRDVEFFPGLRKSWSYTFMVNDDIARTGRPAGSVGWAGLANLFYWIDRKTGIGGFWATQILPFFDEASLSNYLAFETEVYKSFTESAA